MSVFEAIGLLWVIFTSAIASIEILFLAYVGVKSLISKHEDSRDGGIAVEVKEMFKMAR